MTLFRPCIDLHQGKVKQIVGKTLTNEHNVTTNFESEHTASWFADLYKKDNLQGAHIISLGSGNQDAALSALSTWPNHMQIGGGITSENASFWISNGAQKIIVTSWLFNNNQFDMNRLKEISQIVQPSKLVVDLSCLRTKNGWMVATNRWQTITKTKVDSNLLQEISPFCSEFLIHATDVEGLQQGMDEELIQFLGKHANIPVTYAGGANSIHDLKKVQQLSNGNVDLTIGSALDIFGGKQVSYQECVQFNKDQQVKHA